MEFYNGLPLYNISVDGIDTGMTCISLVDDPAVERDFLCFKKTLKFSTDQSQHIITGVAIIADMPIYRRNGNDEYYVMFGKDAIRDIVEKYSKDELWNTVSLQHDGHNIDGVYCVEMYIKDTQRGISPVGFEDVSDGSLFCTFKIEDEALWDEIVNGDMLNGFSVEVFANFYESDEPNLSVEHLLGDKKKLDFRIIDQLDDLMREKQVADLTVYGNRKLHDAQIHSIGKQNGTRVAVIYADGPYGKQWYIQPIKDIKNVVVVDTPFVEYNYNHPSYKVVDEISDELTIDKTQVVESNDMKDIIFGRKWVMINYNDESDDIATGARQCMVVAWGITHAGNECIRIYERYGDSKTGDIPNYRMLLTRRILNLRVIDYMEPWSPDELDSRYNWGGDRGMETVFEWYH